ncbi:MAG: hypothetical protein ABI559_13275, partial [Chloroflexota bacterium]
MNIALRPRTIISLIAIAGLLAIAALFAVDQAKPAHAAGATFKVTSDTAVGQLAGSNPCTLSQALALAADNT